MHLQTKKKKITGIFITKWYATSIKSIKNWKREFTYNSTKIDYYRFTSAHKSIQLQANRFYMVRFTTYQQKGHQSYDYYKSLKTILKSCQPLSALQLSKVKMQSLRILGRLTRSVKMYSNTTNSKRKKCLRDQDQI
jgi:hypothetical protein